MCMMVMLLVIMLCSCKESKKECKHEFEKSKYRVERESCTSEGVGIKVCGKCGYEEKETLPKTEHNYVKISSTQTCEKAGLITFECTECKDKYEEKGEALKHQWVTGSCMEGTYCMICDAINSDKDSVTHNWTHATCLKERHCVDCGITEGKKSDHDYDGTKCIDCGKAAPSNTKTVTCKGVKFIVPKEITANNYDTVTKITDIDITFEDVWESYSTFIVNYSAECLKEEGYDNAFSYSLYDKDGYVVASGFERATDMKTGEKTRNQHFTFDLPHVSGDLKTGETYTLEISGKE